MTIGVAKSSLEEGLALCTLLCLKPDTALSGSVTWSHSPSKVGPELPLFVGGPGLSCCKQLHSKSPFPGSRAQPRVLS